MFRYVFSSSVRYDLYVITSANLLLNIVIMVKKIYLLIYQIINVKFQEILGTPGLGAASPPALPPSSHGFPSVSVSRFPSSYKDTRCWI